MREIPVQRLLKIPLQDVQGVGVCVYARMSKYMGARIMCEYMFGPEVNSSTLSQESHPVGFKDRISHSKVHY